MEITQAFVLGLSGILLNNFASSLADHTRQSTLILNNRGLSEVSIYLRDLLSGDILLLDAVLGSSATLARFLEEAVLAMRISMVSNQRSREMLLDHLLVRQFLILILNCSLVLDVLSRSELALNLKLSGCSLALSSGLLLDGLS